MSDIQVIGVKETIKELRRLDPELRKQFNRDAKKVAQPVVDKARNSYPTRYLSGMARAWSQRGRQLFPYSQRDAQRGVVFQIKTSRSAVGILTIIQKNPAAAIIDMAGKSNGEGAQGERYVRALALFYGQPSRVMWPAYESTKDQVQREMLDLVRDASETVQNRITVIR
jgi:hypothetical protein